MVANRPSMWRGGAVVLALNAICFALALGFQQIRMHTIGAEPENALQGVAKSDLTFLVLWAASGFGSFAAAVREAGLSQALVLATFSSAVFYIVFVLVAGQLWGS